MPASASQSARARVRVELEKEIRDAARARLGLEGPAGLSLRAVARDLGMVPSALYRYYESRDALLTALIIDAYRDVGEAARQADASVDDQDFARRWLTTTRAVRAWALAHPQEWALIYGSPVPGYRAPSDTVAAALVVTSTLGHILGQAQRAGRLRPIGDLPIPADLSPDLEAMALLTGTVPEPVGVASVVAIGYVIGAISLELFGQYDNAIEARSSLWDAAMTLVARTVGLEM
jgi:AcrR family transcriptional regulator